MELRPLGRSGLLVSRLALGTMTWGRDTDEHEARDQLLAFVEAGGTLVDTADVYADGVSEQIVGPAASRRSVATRVVLATKAVSRPGTERRFDASRGHLLAALDASLRRLGVDHVDLWQLHAWDPLTPLDETLVGARRRRGLAARCATSASATTPAGRPRRPRRCSRPRAGAARAGLDPGGVLAAAARHRARGRRRGRTTRGSASCPGRRWGAGCSPASTATARPPTPARASSHFASFVVAVPRRRRPPRRRRRVHGRRRARRRTPRGGAGLGARPARASSRRSSGARTAAQLRGALTVEDLDAARRDRDARSTRCRRPCARYPDHGWNQR